MITSFFHEIAPLKGGNQQTILEACESIKPGLFSQLEDTDDLPRAHIGDIIMYIIFAYSKESPKVVMGVSMRSVKEVIATYLKLPDNLFQYTVEMKHSVVRRVIMEFLDYQLDRDYRHLMWKKDLYELMINAQMEDVMDEEGKLDMKKVREYSKELESLLTDIESYEAKMATRFQFVIDNVNDINEVDSGQIHTLRIEENKFIRNK